MEIKTICSLRGIKTLNTLPLFKYDKYTLTHGAPAIDKIFPESIFKDYAGNMIFQACSQFPFFYSISMMEQFCNLLINIYESP